MPKEGRPCHNAPECREIIPPQKGSSRPRKFCVKCRPPRNRPNPRVIPMSGATEPPNQPRRAPTGVVASYEARLAASEVLDSPEGAHVMLLAELLESGSRGGGMTAAGAASLSRELRAAMDSALKDAPAEPDVLDELEERRRRKASGA